MILLDAYDCLIKNKSINYELIKLLNSFDVNIIVLTNASKFQYEEFGFELIPYPIFSFHQNPTKLDPKYFEFLIKHMFLNPENIIYVEHSKKAIQVANQFGFKCFHFEYENGSIKDLEIFLNETKIYKVD